MGPIMGRPLFQIGLGHWCEVMAAFAVGRCGWPVGLWSLRL